MDLPPNPTGTTQVEARLAALEAQVRELQESKTNSPKFWSRAWAITGHQFAVTGAIYLGLLALAIIAAVVGGSG